MSQKFTAALALMLMLMSQVSFSQKIVAIGSSTVAGGGADPIDSAWLNLYTLYLKKQGLPVTTVNLGVPGTYTFNGMPSSFATPSPHPDIYHPWLGHNITYALSLNPDIVFIAYPSNDLMVGFSVALYLSNLRTIYDSAVKLKKKAYVVTSQPRNGAVAIIKQRLLAAKDSILLEFPGHALDFWTPLADPVTLEFKPGLTNDNIHPNNKGHQLLFQVVRNANIIPVVLAITLTDLTAVFQDQTVRLQWRSSDQSGPAVFVVQRSSDGLVFDDRWQIPSDGASSAADFSWTDSKPLFGKSFYRIKLIEAGDTSYSRIISILDPSADWKIGKLYSGNGSLWNIEILSGKERTIALCVVDASGKNILRRTLYVNLPSMTFPVDLSGFAAGEYFLQLSTPDGGHSTRAIQKR